MIDSLQEKIKNNKKQLENNEYQISLLKNEISSLKNIRKKESKEKSKDIIKKDMKKEKAKTLIKDDIEDKIIDKNKIKTNEVKTIYSSHKSIKEVKLNDFKNLKIKCQNQNKDNKYSEVIVEFLPTHEIYLMKIYNKNFLKDHNLTLLKKSELDKLNYPFLCNLLFFFQEKDNIYFVETLLLEHFFDNNKLPKNDEDKARFYITQIALTIEYLNSIGRKYNNLKLEIFFWMEKAI